MIKNTKIKFSILFTLTSILFISASDYKFLMFVPLIILIPFVKRKYGFALEKGLLRKLTEAFPLLYFVFSVVSGTNLFYTLSNLLIIILIIKQILPCKEKDYYEIFLVGVLLILLSSVSTISLVFGIFLFAFLVSGTLMLSFAGIRSDEIKVPKIFYRKVLIFSLISMIFSFMLFFSFPRLSLGYFHGIKMSPQTQSGFSTDVVIEKGAVKLDSRVVMRVEVKDSNIYPPLYLSGMHYAYFNGMKWVKTKNVSKIFPYDSNNDFKLTSGMVKSTIFLEPNGTDVLFGPEKFVGVHGEFLYLKRNEFGDFLTDQTYYKTIRYDAFSSIGGKSDVLIREPLGKKDKSKYLQVPKLPAEFGKIAEESARNGKSAEQKARNIANFLKKNYKYSLNPTATDIKDFILNKKTGYCQHFATAFVLFARINGIPARLVSGFATREYNPNGKYFIVRAKDAHTWAEVYITGKGWVRVDPTPPSSAPSLSRVEMLLDSIRMSWYRNVITYNSAKQMQMLTGIKTGITSISVSVMRSTMKFKMLFKRNKTVVIVVLMCIILFFLLFAKEKTKKETAILRILERKIGKKKGKGETLLEFAKRNGKLEELYEPIMLYYELRFSGRASPRKEADLVKRIEKLVKGIT